MFAHANVARVCVPTRQLSVVLLVMMGLVLAAPSGLVAQIPIRAGLDSWETEAPTDIDLPLIVEGFFGVRPEGPATCISDTIPEMPEFPFQGHPFPDIFGVPNPFPVDQLETRMKFLDRHGNEVSESSQHKVSSSVEVIQPVPPYNFDTVVSRGPSEPLTLFGDSSMVDVEMTWLSLESIMPLVVTFSDTGSGAPCSITEAWEVYIGLSGTEPQVVGRMEMTADRVEPGTPNSPMFVKGTTTLGTPGSPESQQVDEGFQDPVFNVFEEDPNALGLPVYFQVRFVGPTGEERVVDNPLGLQGPPIPETRALFHNDQGEFIHVPIFPKGDINMDNFLNNQDIQPFVDAVLTVGAGSEAALTTSPEPSGNLLAIIGVLSLLTVRRRRMR